MHAQGDTDGRTMARSKRRRAPRRLALPGALAAALLALLLGGAPVTAGAHQLRAALTSLALNARTAQVEVIHRFYVHDAEHAVERLGGMRGDIGRDPALRDAFAHYVRTHFTLADANRTPLPIALVGAELDGDFLWVYEELPGDAWEKIAFVGHSSLQELWPEQENRVNLRTASGVHTVILHAGDGLQATRPD
ncbi:MAG TPA: DUF6702 family protein [Pseudomonadales bacterium]|nr:DUF6702 family protein [Pseudomonadales bacterium]